MGAIPVKVEHQVRMIVSAVEPALNSRLTLLQCDPDNVFRSGPIRVCGSSRDVRFALQALAQFSIRLADMAAQGVSASTFRGFKIMKWTANLARCAFRARGVLWRRLTPGDGEDKHESCCSQGEMIRESHGAPSMLLELAKPQSRE